MKIFKAKTICYKTSKGKKKKKKLMQIRRILKYVKYHGEEMIKYEKINW